MVISEAYQQFTYLSNTHNYQIYTHTDTHTQGAKFLEKHKDCVTIICDIDKSRNGMPFAV